MTWVVGGISPVGHAILVSDVRVTFSDGRQAGLIQKAFCVGRYLAAGFSGSVRIGFALIEDLKNTLHLDDEKLAWDPLEVTEAWSHRASEIFRAHDSSETRNGCSLLVTGVSPTKNNGGSPFPQVHLMRLASPKFTPTYSRRNFAALQIGSGSKVGPYKGIVRSYFRDPELVLNFAGWGATGLGAYLAHTLGREVTANPRDGISPHMHIVACSRGELFEGANNYSAIENDVERPRLLMPQISRTYAQFEQAVQRARIAAGATA